MLISIEGNVGSGKSTFFNYMKSYFSAYYNKPHSKNVYFVDEPVETWESIKDSSGKSLLDNFYEDQSRYSFLFQITAYITRLNNLKKILKVCKPDDIIIMERCVFSDYNVFARMLNQSGKLSDIEFESYKLWFDSFLEDIPNITFVYLKTDFTICHERIKLRNREAEKDIPLKYLEQCYSFHEDWLKAEENCILLDGNKGLESHAEYIEVIKKLIHYDTNYPPNFNRNDSDNEDSRDYWFNKAKFKRRMYDKTVSECKEYIKKIKSN